MRRFNINVDGKAYDVQVEEMGAGAPAAPVAAVAPQVSAPAAAPVAAAAPVVAAPAPAPAGGGTKVEAPMPGTIVDVRAKVGDVVKAGQAIVVLEAMKMENDIVAPIDGTITSIVVKKGDSVNSNDVIATVA